MLGISKSSPYRELLIDLICAINHIVPMSMENQALIVITLDTEEKIIRFKDWVQSKLRPNNRLDTTEKEIMSVVTAYIRLGREIP